MIGSNLITEQFIGANQKIFNYGDLIFTQVAPRAPTEDNADNSQCLATAHDRCTTFAGSNTITFNRADVASRLTDHPHIASGDNPQWLTRDLAFRLGLFLDDDDLADVDLSTVTEPTEITFAPKADAFAAYGSITVTKHIPCLIQRSVGTFGEGQDGSNENPLEVEIGKVYEFPFSDIPTLAGLESVAYPIFGGERPGASPAYGNHGISTFQKDGKWWCRLFAPLVFNSGVQGGNSGQMLNFNFLDASQQGNFTTKYVLPTENTIQVDSATLVLCKGLNTDRLVIPRGESVIIPMEYIAVVEKPEFNLSGITCDVDGVVGAICVTHMTGGVALGLPSDIYVKVTNNVEEGGDATINFTNVMKDNRTFSYPLYFTFE